MEINSDAREKRKIKEKSAAPTVSSGDGGGRKDSPKPSQTLTRLRARFCARPNGRPRDCEAHVAAPRGQEGVRRVRAVHSAAQPCRRQGPKRSASRSDGGRCDARTQKALSRRGVCMKAGATIAGTRPEAGSCIRLVEGGRWSLGATTPATDRSGPHMPGPL